MKILANYGETCLYLVGEFKIINSSRIISIPQAKFIKLIAKLCMVGTRMKKISKSVRKI